MRNASLRHALVVGLALLLGLASAEAGSLGQRYAERRAKRSKASVGTAASDRASASKRSRRSKVASRRRGRGGLGAVYAARKPVRYNDVAGENDVAAADRDEFGNAAGSENDLGRDGAFAGQQIAVLQLYAGEGFDFELPRKALEEKGFAVHRWLGVPKVDEMAHVLKRSSQFWLLSGPGPGGAGVDLFAQLHAQVLLRQAGALEGLVEEGPGGSLEDGHVSLLRSFFESGHGLYLWGDNEPYYHEANIVSRALFGTEMSGNVLGDQVVPIQVGAGKPGLVRGHLLTTGLQHLYEGITIATIQPSQSLRPLIVGSAGNLVAGYHEQGGRRAILDGGFTRLFVKWDTAGTARYVKNAAAWLANSERFDR